MSLTETEEEEEEESKWVNVYRAFSFDLEETYSRSPALSLVWKFVCGMCVVSNPQRIITQPTVFCFLAYLV